MTNARPPLEVLYQDDVCVAINKPSGLLVHRSQIAFDVAENTVTTLTKQLGKYVLPAHRIDRPTSGVLLFAFTSEIARILTTDFELHRVTKSYLAIVRGHTDDSGTIDKPLVSEYQKHKHGADDDEDEPVPQVGAEALTTYKTLGHCEIPFSAGKYPTSRYSLVQAMPLTGRTHQIRRHLQHLRHPIIGDGKHGDHRHNHLFKDEFDIHRLLLVAHELEINHPVTGERLMLRASVGPEFDRALSVLGLPAIEPVPAPFFEPAT